LPALALLAACAQPELVLTNKETGAMGRGTATGATFSSLGDIEVSIEGTQYQGTWVAMRDPGHATLSFWSPGPKDSGVGMPNKTNGAGKTMRCEFSYSMSSFSGIGLCKSSSGQTYDLMLSII
jgi:hypothetical protein